MDAHGNQIKFLLVSGGKRWEQVLSALLMAVILTNQHTGYIILASDLALNLYLVFNIKSNKNSSICMFAFNHSQV
jgi:hypothetical protein